MLFRTYRYSLKLNKKQLFVFKNLLKYIYILHTELSPYLKQRLSFNELRSITKSLFEKYSFTPLFTEMIFPQVLANLQKDPSLVESAFPLTFKHFSYNENTNTLSLPFCKDIQLSHYRRLPSKIYKVDLYYKNGKWYVHFLVSKRIPEKKTSNLKVIGIDIGLKSFAFLSNGKSIKNPRFFEEMKEKIAIEQQKLSKKQKGSKNWIKQKKKINNLYSKLHRKRIDFLHKLTHYLTETYDVIGIENIHIRELQRKKHLRNSLSDASWGEFINMLKYKCEEKGKYLIQVERFYPSSQICSKCGNKRWLPVHIRTYRCSKCSYEIDRDFNAAVNIEKRAKEIFLKTFYISTT